MSFKIEGRLKDSSYVKNTVLYYHNLLKNYPRQSFGRVISDFNPNPDKTFNAQTFMVELTDKYNCQEQIKALKEVNHWNKPLSMSNGNGGMV